MKKKFSPIDFYGYDCDSTMVKNHNNECFKISKVKELKNQKYIKVEEESESDDTDNNR